MEISIQLSKQEEGASIGIRINGLKFCNIAQDEMKNLSSSEEIVTNPTGPQTAKRKKEENRKKRKARKVGMKTSHQQLEPTMDQNHEQVEVIKEQPKQPTKTEIIVPVHLSIEEEGIKEAAKKPSTENMEATMDQSNEHMEVIEDPLTKKEVVIPVGLSTEEEGSEKLVMQPSTEGVETTMGQNNEQVDVIKEAPSETEIDVPVHVSTEEEGVFIDIKIKGIQHFDFTYPPMNNPSASKEIVTNPVGHRSSKMKKKKKKKRRTKKVVKEPSPEQVEAKLDDNNDHVKVIKKEIDVPAPLSIEEKGDFIEINKKGRQSSCFAQDPKKRTLNSKETLINPPDPPPVKKKKKNNKKRRTRKDVKNPSTNTVWLKIIKWVLIGLFLLLVMCYYFEIPFIIMIGGIFYGLGHFNTSVKTLQDLYKNYEMIYKFLKDTLFP